MALCSTCSNIELSQIFDPPQERSPTAADYGQKFFQHESLDGLCFRHSDGISQIQIAASAGCRLCTMLFDAFKRQDPVAAQEVADLPIILAPGEKPRDEWNDPPQFPPKLRSFILMPQDELIELCDLDISIDKEASPNLLRELPFEPLSKTHRHPGDTGCVALTSRWLSACLEHHNCPSPDLNGPDLLTRFLKIENGREYARLVEFPPASRLQPWAALSYRWGNVEPSEKLVRRNEAKLKTGVAISSLGATIQDAITVCRGLGIQYLWVDVHCIFQDDESDWLQQSSQMHYIYGQATVTIVSVDTNNASQHFLEPRENASAPILWKRDVNQGVAQGVQNLPPVYVSSIWPDEHDQLNGPWTQRAWTLQEGLLSNRILFYSSHQVAWICCSVVEYERGVRHVPSVEFGLSIVDEPGGRPFWHFDLFTKLKLLETYCESPECHTEHDSYRIWYAIIEDYSTRNLTYMRDRLVAISAIAKVYSRILRDDIYIAGHWRSNMIPGLLWYAKGFKLFAGKINQTGDVEAKIPSWSWASTPPGYHISNDWVNKSFRPLSVLENVSFSLEDSTNPFGGVLNAEITIRGPVHHFSRLYHAEWRSVPTEIPAFERHLSRVIELDYRETATDFSREDSYLAILLVQGFPSIDNRLDALVLRSLHRSHKNKSDHVFERLGVLKMGFYSMSSSASVIAMVSAYQKSLQSRLRPGHGFRRSKRLFCRDFFDEYAKCQWPRESVTII